MDETVEAYVVVGHGILTNMRDHYDEKQRRILRKKVSLLKRVARIVLTLVERRRRRFVTFHERPAYASNIRTLSIEKDYREFAIVLQGPILHEFNFTIETVKLYRKYYKNVALVLSTWQWDDRDRIAIEQAREAGASVVLNEESNYLDLDKKYVNMNLQILSSRSGIQEAGERGARWVLKTRTDQRMYNPATLDICYGMTQSFPLAESTGLQKYRITALNRGKSRAKLYHLVDWFIFGAIDDVTLYWAASEVSMVPSHESDREKVLSAETYLFTEFLKKVGRSLEWTKQDSLRAFAERCIILDQPMLDVYWRKYEHHREYRFVNYYARRSRNFCFADWLRVFVEARRQ